MVEMKSDEVVLSLAAQLASWRVVLVHLHTWATCKLWQPKDFYKYSIFLADCLDQSKQTVCESAGGAAAAATESRKVGKGPRKRRYADVDGPGAKPEPELGPRGPTLKKQVRKGFDGLDLRLRLRPADSVDITQDFEWQSEARALDEDLFFDYCRESKVYLEDCLQDLIESMDPAGSPSSIRKVADTARPSSSSPSAGTVPGWRSFFCLGNGK